MPLDDDEHRDEVLEIKDRIVEEHHRGGHVTGPVAGCAICAQLTTASSFVSTSPPVSAPPTSLEELARLRVLSSPERDDEPELIELALQDGERALADAANGRHGMATVAATVGVIRAVAAIDDTLRKILAAIAGDDDPEGLYDGSAEAAANRGPEGLHDGETAANRSLEGYPKGTIGGDVDDA